MNGHFFVKGTVGELAVSLRRRGGAEIYAETSVPLRTTNAWQRVDFSLTPKVNDAMAEFAICAAGGGWVQVDDAYLADEPTNAFGRMGCREDIVDGFRTEGVTFLRWGGSMANSWGYVWKNMVGDRRPYEGFWTRTGSTGFLYKEFVQMAELMRLPCAFSIYAYESIDRAAEIARWLRKFKGEIYVQVGNEECAGYTPTCGECSLGDCRRYCEGLRLIVTAMRKENPRLKFVSALMYDRSHQDVMDEGFRLTDGLVEYWDLHLRAFGDDLSKIEREARLDFASFHDMIARLNPKSKMKLAVFEENGNEHGLRRALAHAVILGVCRAEGDFLLTSCPANALQPYLQNDNGWDQGQVFFTPDKVWLQPCAWAQQMAASAHRDLLVDSSASDPGLFVSAAKSRDGKTLVLHLVNGSREEKCLELSFANGADWRVERVRSLSGDGPLAHNTPLNMGSVIPKDETEDFRHARMIRPYSYTVVEFSAR